MNPTIHEQRLTLPSVPDIMRHMSNLIVRAEKEVILATNYWQNSVASKYITNAMKELSRRAGERGERIVFKLEYDRGSPKQLLENHYLVEKKEYMGKAVAIPAPEDIPNIDLQVINYHKPLLGTFHCKYMVVDRSVIYLVAELSLPSNFETFNVEAQLGHCEHRSVQITMSTS